MASNNVAARMISPDLETEMMETQESASVLSASGERRTVPAGPRSKVWIDLENSPHVPFFGPIMQELEKLNCEIVLTARDCFQVCELADMAGLKYRKIGRHYGKHRLAKLAGLGIRVLQLAPFILRQRPAISVSHGSSSLIVLVSSRDGADFGPLVRESGACGFIPKGELSGARLAALIG